MLSIQDRLFVLCGGYTIAGTVKGAYEMASGAKQVDESLQIWVVCAASDMDELRALIREIGKDLKQESMYFEVTGAAVEFIE